MKAVWKGYLKCSLATIPIKMFNAVAKNSPWAQPQKASNGCAPGGVASYAFRR
jgi:hypothetical protein